MLKWFQKPNPVDPVSVKRLSKLRQEMKKRPPVQEHVPTDKARKDSVLNNLAFTQAGSLSRVLIVGDLVYAGIISKPTLDEMGTIIKDLNKGAVAGLTKIGLLPSTTKKHSSEDVVEAFRNAYDTLQSNLTKEEWDAMGMDVLTVEHSLCKYQRSRKCKAY